MRATVLLALATLGASWIDPHATAREAARLYAEGKFAEAAAKYREALVDDPDSRLLHYNAGAADYRDGKYDDTVVTLGRIAGSDADPTAAARAAYNIGNAKYRLGAAAETSNPQQALGLYAEAVAAYRRAMGADPADEDSKFNHELVEKKLADLKKKLEEQQKNQEKNQDQQKDQQQKDQQQQQQDKQEQQQDQQGQEQKQDQAQQDQEKQDDQQQAQQDQQKPDEQKQDQQQAQQQADRDQKQDAEQQRAQAQPQDQGGEKKPDAQPSPGGEAIAGDRTNEEMSPRDAEALLDGQRDQEVRPEEIVRKLQGARVAEPREDW